MLASDVIGLKPSLVCNIVFLRNLLGNKDDLQSDSEDGDDDDDCFVPAKIDLQSSSDEEAEAKMDSEDELVVKRRRGSRTPRSTEKTRTSARTPRKTPSKKVSQISPLTFSPLCYQFCPLN